MRTDEREVVANSKLDLDADESVFERLNAGDPVARDELLAEIYGSLRRMAGQFMAGEPVYHTLQPTALVNEAYARIFKNTERRYEGRRHFFGLAAAAMRTILVDHARRKTAAKRVARGTRVNLDDLVVSFEAKSGGLVDFDDALRALARVDPKLVELIELRFFAGRTMAEAAAILGISERKAYRWWNVARAWLSNELGKS